VQKTQRHERATPFPHGPAHPWSDCEMDTVSESYDGAGGGATTALGDRLATDGGDDGRRVRIRRRGQLYSIRTL
jgi:hypothetical protein